MTDEATLAAARFMVIAHAVGYGLNGAVQGGVLNDRQHVVPYGTIAAYTGALIGAGAATRMLQGKATRGEIITRGAVGAAITGNTLGLLLSLPFTKKRSRRIVGGLIGAGVGAVLGGLGTRWQLDKAGFRAA